MGEVMSQVVITNHEKSAEVIVANMGKEKKNRQLVKD